MAPKSSAELRQAWDDFFVARGHTVVPSASLIPTHPSAPMFTNSGMMPFVPIFLGEEPVPFSPPRAVSTQPCVRAGGKHNDLDAIGRSLRHLSFFEMLGNFSFGEYFKEKAIPWAWEFVTEVLELDGDRIWVTVHVSDDEAEQIWREAVGFPGERIQRLDRDNFWEMGETGPCGPSSEIFWDFGPHMGPEGGPANPAAEERYVEIWNLVFQQYLRSADGALRDLPSKNIDTGAGLERILGVLNGSPSLYTADTLVALIEEAQSVTGQVIGRSELGDIALRLMADHARTMTFLVADGVIPSNDDRGYVLRRIIRRAIRFAYLLGVERPVLPAMVERTIDLMGDDYPEIVGGRGLVVPIIRREEESFRNTLANGSQILDTQLDKLDAGGMLPGDVVFQLHDTYGFPFEVTQEMAELRGFDVDVEGFEGAMAAQRQRARASGKGGGVATGDEVDAQHRLLAEHGPTEFTGREEVETEATIIGIVGDAVFLDRTPQPHRYAHPALGAAPGAGLPRQATGFAGRARPAAVRLQPLRAGHRRAGPGDRRSRQPRDPRQRAGPPLRDHDERGPRNGCHRLLRRQVRRHRACARGRPALGRALRRDPRAPAGRYRPAQGGERGGDRVQPAAHRGGHPPRPGRK